jgi:hypothetical protein
MKCPLCESRKAKRYCPAKSKQICAVCCGTKREVEIDCPRDCIYLQTGREYETERIARTSPPPRRTERLWNRQFLRRTEGVIVAMCQIISETRKQLPELIDADVAAVLEALTKTFDVLDKGIYYDSRPSTFVQQTLYAGLKRLLEGPEERKIIEESRLTTSQILDCLQFFRELSAVITLPRPKSRAFLDHVNNIAQQSTNSSPEEPKLIFPA